MVPELPSFLRRRMRLHEARKALLGGAPSVALEHLSDRCLALSDEADRLRERALDALCREAARHAAEGRADAAREELARVAEHDPERAARWRRRLAEERLLDPAGGPAAAGGRRMSRSGESQLLTRLEGLLAEMRTRRGQRGAGPPSRDGAVGRAAADADRTPAPAARRFQLAVDDAGEYLVVSGDQVLLGHARNSAADLPFLADVDARHALLERRESFHGGPLWWIAPAREQRLRVAGRAVGGEGSALSDGDLVELSPNLALRFRAPEPGSSSGMLELLHGAECEGAQRVLLLAPGPAGRMRFGVRARRHVRLRGADLEVAIERRGEELCVGSPAGLRASGPGLAPGVDADGDPELCVPCPPPARVDFVVGLALGGRPPFGFSIAPLRGAGAPEAGA